MRRNGDGRPASRRRTVVALGLLWLLLALVIVVVQYSRAPNIKLQWQTETEFNSAGFNVYRSEGPSGPFAKLNRGLIPSGANTLSGASYDYVDSEVVRGKTYYYRLEDVALDGTGELHGTFEAVAPEISAWAMLMAGGCVLVGVGLLLGPRLSEVTRIGRSKPDP